MPKRKRSKQASGLGEALSGCGCMIIGLVPLLLIGSVLRSCDQAKEAKEAKIKEVENSLPPNHSAIHTLTIDFYTYLSHTPLEEDKAICPSQLGITVKDETGKTLAFTKLLSGTKIRARVRPIVLNCHYSFQAPVTEVSSYEITGLIGASIPLKSMRDMNWTIQGKADPTLRYDNGQPIDTKY